MGENKFNSANCMWSSSKDYHEIHKIQQNQTFKKKNFSAAVLLFKLRLVYLVPDVKIYDAFVDCGIHSQNSLLH